mmetsp:Transcript_11651/g.17699  ORF Transcript_11651/g.17699 Transcript_11651/m.17699 type:complete len:82 (+) Transcript_11651:669-914(+)
MIFSYNDICSERSDVSNLEIYTENPFNKFSFRDYNDGRLASTVISSEVISRILIVDDQAFNIEAVKGILEFVFQLSLDRID